MMHLLLIIFVTFHDIYGMENGISVKEGECPFVVSVSMYGSHICSGIIIDYRNILTTAHPLVDIPPEKLTVDPGKIVNGFIIPDGLYKVKRVYRHPEFRKRCIPGMEHEEFFENDIAVLRLWRLEPWPSWIAPAPLMNTEPSWGPCSECIIASWSHSTPENTQPMKLEWDFVKYVSTEVSQIWGTILLENQRAFNDMIENDHISWEDLGSPIICDNHVIGIVVKGGNRDHPEKPSTVLFIYQYLEFIWEVMTDGLFDIHPWNFPYVVSIWKLNTPLCGGFIVDANHIATTASCVRTIDKNNLRATVGNTYVDISDSTIHWILIKDVLKHPNCVAFFISRFFFRGTVYDIAILTLIEPLVWSPNVSPLVMGESDNFAGGQVCQVLRWKTFKQDSRTKTIALKRSVAIIWDEQQLRTRIPNPGENSFWARTPYLMPIAEEVDAGNPILCGGYPVGIVLRDPYPREWEGPKSARFLKIRPFTEFINNVTSEIGYP